MSPTHLLLSLWLSMTQASQTLNRNMPLRITDSPRITAFVSLIEMLFVSLQSTCQPGLDEVTGCGKLKANNGLKSPQTEPTS